MIDKYKIYGRIIIIIYMYILYKYRYHFGFVITCSIVACWIHFFSVFINYLIYGDDVFLVMNRPVITNHPIGLIYNFISIYIFNTQYNRLYYILSLISKSGSGFNRVGIWRMVLVSVKIILTIIFYMVVDCSYLVFLILTLMVKALFSNSGCAYIYFIKSINFLVEGSFTHIPKIKIILCIRYIGFKINPNKKAAFAQTKAKFITLIENFSPDQIYNALQKDWLESNIKNFKLIQCNTVTTKNSGFGERLHYSILSNNGHGITTCSNPQNTQNFVPIGHNMYGKPIFGCPARVSKGSIITETHLKVSEEVAIMYVKATFRNIGGSVEGVEISDGKLNLLKMDRSEFIKKGEFPECLMTPHFSNSELTQLKNCGLFNEYFSGL